jgi:cytochrome c peroxidase
MILMKKATFLSFLLLGFFAIILSCNKTADPVLGAKTPDLSIEYFYQLRVPRNSSGQINLENFGSFNNFGNFGNVGNLGDTNQINQQKATLGRVLFYDPLLSLNNAISCGSCHKQELAFSDGLAFSVGFGGKTTPRSSMAIVNPVMNHNLFWDSRSTSVRDLVLRPVQNHVEMGMEDLEMLTKKLSQTSYYPDLFQQAYGTPNTIPNITPDHIAEALTNFLTSMGSVDSKFDKESINNFAGFTALERQGIDLFMGKAKCSGCHAGGNFAAADFPGGEYGSDFFGGGGNNPKGAVNIGLDVSPNDNGLSDGKFRIPSLRNIGLTAPYMHDGRFKTLEEVVEHYNSKVAASPHLDVKLTDANGNPQRLHLNALEKKALIAFLNTLTDHQFVTDPKFSNPFK